jgi:hypothetical protein
MDVAQEQPAEATSAQTIFDLQPDPEAKVDVRRLPALARQGIRILWQAGKRELLISTRVAARCGRCCRGRWRSRRCRRC